MTPGQRTQVEWKRLGLPQEGLRETPGITRQIIPK